MIYPIIAYGDPVLKKKALDIDKKYPKLKELIDDMFETMYDSSGVGLAAPQIGLSIRLFIIDGSPFEEDPVKDFKEVFINAVIKEETGVLWKFNEGCLSIPSVREDVQRNVQSGQTDQTQGLARQVFGDFFGGHGAQKTAGVGLPTVKNP